MNYIWQIQKFWIVSIQLYKVRNYALGDVELKRVISIATSRTLIARSDGDYVLMSSEFPRNLDLIQKYKVQRFFAKLKDLQLLVRML